MKPVKYVLSLAAMALVFNGCMSESGAGVSSPETSGKSYSADTTKLSDDHVLIGLSSSNGVAARPMAELGTDNILHQLRWADQKVIEYSFIGTIPSGMPAIFDTAARSWISLVDPERAGGVVFRRVDDNDASADLTISFSTSSDPSTYAVTGMAYYTTPVNGILPVAYATLTFYATTAGTANNWATNKGLAYNVILHELGHVMLLDDEYTSPYVNEVMYGYLGRTEARRWFGTDDVNSINEIFNGAASNFSPYTPVFITRTSAGYNTTPILGWADAKTAVEQGKWVYLQGLVGKPGNANLTTKVYPLQATNGSLAYWNTNSVSGYNTELAGCPDVAQSPAAGALFSALPANSTHAILETRYFNGLYTDATNQILWGTTAPYACQRQLGDFYTLRANY